METVSYFMTIMMEKVKGGFAGTPASMCSAKGTVIQGLWICSEWLCLRGGKLISVLSFLSQCDRCSS